MNKFSLPCVMYIARVILRWQIGIGRCLDNLLDDSYAFIARSSRVVDNTISLLEFELSHSEFLHNPGQVFRPQKSKL